MGDGLRDVEGDFDAIHVGAAAAEVPPALLRRLRPGGRMVLPLTNALGEQWLTVVRTRV